MLEMPYPSPGVFQQCRTIPTARGDKCASPLPSRQLAAIPLQAFADPASVVNDLSVVTATLPIARTTWPFAASCLRGAKIINRPALEALVSASFVTHSQTLVPVLDVRRRMSSNTSDEGCSLRRRPWRSNLQVLCG